MKSIKTKLIKYWNSFYKMSHMYIMAYDDMFRSD